MSNKRESVFSQGGPDNPFPDRDDAEPVRKATAAQMASRKIKAVRGRRAGGTATSGLAHTISQPAPSFSFGGVDNNNPNPNNSSGASPFGFGQQQAQPAQPINQFGGSAVNSFPPAQPSEASNSFTNNSFPAFGGNSTGFNFTAGGNNPFSASTPTPTPTTAMNGSGSGGFGGSIFNTGASSTNTPFAGFGQNTTSSTAPSGSMFGTSGAPQSSMFGSNASSAQSSVPATTAAPANPFGSLSTVSTPASPFGFGSTQPSPAPVQESTPAAKPVFGSFQPTSTPARETTPVSKPAFGSFGSFQPTTSTAQETTPASKSGFGSFQPTAGTSQETTSTPKPSTFGTPLSATPASSTSETPKSTPFSLFGTKTQDNGASTPAASTSFFSNNFGAASQSGSTTPSLFGTKQPDEGSNGATAGKSMFAGFGASSQSGATPPSGSASSLFGSQTKSEGNSTPSAAPFPAPATSNTQVESTTTSTSAPSLFKSFGPTSTSTPKPDAPATSLFSASTPGNLFGGVQPPALTTTTTANTFNDADKKQELSAPAAGLNKTTFSANTPGSGTSLFSQSFQPQTTGSLQGGGGGGGFSFQQPSTPSSSKTSSLFSQSQPTKPVDLSSQQQSPAPFNPVNKPTPSHEPKAIDSSPAQSAPQQNASKNLSDTPSLTVQQTVPTSSMPNLTGGAAPPHGTSQPEIPSRFPTCRPGPNWGVLQGSDEDLRGLALQVMSLNQNYLRKLTGLQFHADWSPLSQWHCTQTEILRKKIVAMKKKMAAEKGITGHESSLSVKRKGTTEDGSHSEDVQDATPSKKPRTDVTPSTPTPKGPSLPSTTPKASPPVSNTSSLFGSVLNKSTGSAASTSSEKTAVPPKTASSQPGFSFLSNGSKPVASPSPFQMPSSGSAGKTSVFGSGGGLLGQFSTKAKSYEQLVAERKAKDKEDDYDSDDETEEEWSAKWDKKEAERVAKENEASTPAAQESAVPQSSNNDGLNLLSGFGKPANSASTSGLFGSGVGSPAPSMGGKSVFDTPETAQSPASNPFAHLSSGPSSNNQDDDDDDEDVDEEVETKSTQPKKRKVFDDTESDSGESTEDSFKRTKVDAIRKPTLADRITKDVSDAKDDSEKENGDPSEALTRANGFQTPAKPFAYFDFSKAAGAQSAPPKQDKVAGDQTFKFGTPIKFGSAVKEAPTFQFQPATPSAADFSATPSRPPPPTSTFSFLNAGTSSTPGSVLSSRAPTPLSETETSGKESTADNDDDEGEKHAQMDLSRLTAEELAENDVLLEIDQAICKHQVDKAWTNYARGPLWILKNKQSGQAIVRMRLSSGNTMLNYNIIRRLKTNVQGQRKTMVGAVGQKKDGKTGNLIFAVKTPEMAAQLSKVYNDNVPAY